MIIDFHSHVSPAIFREERQSLFAGEPDFERLYGAPHSRLAGVKQLLRDMDEEEVHKSVIFGFPWEKADLYRRHNDYIIESVNAYPERLIGFCCFSPLSREGPREAERCLRSGLSGVGELAVYGSGITTEITRALKDVMALSLEFDVPLLIHTNEPVGAKYPGKSPMSLSQIYRFLKAFPLNRIVLAHWGGGLFFYALLKKEARGVLRNVWFDTAASPYTYSPDVYRIAGEIIGFEKILFGSDYPLLSPQRYFEEMESADLSPESIRQITGLNATQLLKLSL